MAKMTKVGVLALPIVVKDYGDGEFGYEIGMGGDFIWDAGYRSFDDAASAASIRAEHYEAEMLERYRDAVNGIKPPTEEASQR